MTQNPFSFNYTTLLQTSTYKNKKFDIKNAGFMRPAITFLNIQLSNSRVCGENVGTEEKIVHGAEGDYSIICTDEFYPCE